jgi:hypothetical protein
MERRELLAALGLSVAALAGCGGGGSHPANLSSAPGEAAINAYHQATHQTTLSAMDSSGNNYTLQLSSVPNAGTTTFEGNAPAYSTVDTVTIDANGMVAASSVGTSYFLLNPYVPLGQVSSTGTPYAVVTSSFPVPTTWNVGSSGPVSNLTFYHDSTKTAVDISETSTYSVEARNSTTLLVCLNSVLSNVTAQGTADGQADGTGSACYSVDASGNMALVSITVMVKGVSLKFQ